MTSMAMEHLEQMPVIGTGIGEKGFQREIHRTDGQIERAGLDRLDVAVVFLARNRFPLDDVAGPEERHKIFQVRQLLRRIVDRRWRDAEELIAASATHR